MDMPKLLIADNDEVFRQSLCDRLSPACNLRTCSDGKQALELLTSFRPDILLLDLLLPHIDGLSLLNRMMKDTSVRPVVLATIRFTSPYVASSLEKLGVYYVVMKPCDISAICVHIQDISAQLQPAPLTQADIHSAVSNLLLNLGFSTKLDGFSFLLSAIPMYAEDPHQSVTKELYTAVGHLYNKDARQVERSIRNAIDQAWQKGDCAIWQSCFGFAPGMPLPRPSNREFISRMAVRLAQQTAAWEIA